MNGIDERLRECFIAVFPLAHEGAVETLTRADDAWDSLATISLITVLEEEFGVMLDDDTVDTLTSFSAVRSTLIALGVG